jgi:surfeit locus 1 family protein
MPDAAIPAHPTPQPRTVVHRPDVHALLSTLVLVVIALTRSPGDAPSDDQRDLAADDEPAAVTRTPPAARLLCAALLLAGAGFAALGVWQLHRLAWKRELIARIDARIHTPPVAAPGPAAWPAISASADAYRRVQVRGVFLNDRETRVQAVTVRGAGYWVMTPLLTDRGFTVLVNRGFVPPDRRDPATRADSRIAAATQVSGLLRVSEPRGAFLRSNDPADDRWYSRDVPAIAQATGLAGVAPYFIDADAVSGPPDGPVGGLTVIDLPNHHLAYALTWFALAALAIGAATVVIADARTPPAPANDPTTRSVPEAALPRSAPAAGQQAEARPPARASDPSPHPGSASILR